jgi:SAM-dependent methyltransferase
MNREKKVKYNLDLFLQLNEEYKDKPIVRKPRSLLSKPRLEAAKGRASRLDSMLGVDSSQRVLEIGCGRGDLCYVLAKEYQCESIGVDVKKYKEWKEYNEEKLNLLAFDVTEQDYSALGKFDRIHSWAVWEHIKHPFSALKAVKDLLQEDGKVYVSANLYRGPKASHRYREVYFPWPHLLFTDDIFEEFYQYIGKPPAKPAWVNKLTYAQYKLYFDFVDLSVEQEWLTSSKFDEDFYNRFEDVLSRYPKFDLTHDFINVILSHKIPKKE